MFDDPRIAEAMRTYVVETAPVLALYLDADHCVAGANALARQVLRGEAFGRPFAEQIVDFTRSLNLPSLIRQGSAVHRLTLSTVSGIPETLCFRFFPLPEGTLALGSLDFQEQRKLRDEALGLNRELNNLTRQLHQANAELRELNELKNHFIGMAAHDLRNPVGVIMIYSQLVLDAAGGCLGDEQRGFLRAILAAAAGMKRLIDNFLDVSVIESGHLRLERARTDMAEILSSVLPLVRLVAARKKVELLAEAEGDARPLVVDVAKVRQVLINLLSNAVEHSNAGQRVWLAARREASELVFSVRDEGPGIAFEDQERLFAPFVRAGTRKTAGERSVGLGLSIAWLVVEAHGGRIWVESIPGAGSTFLFALPVQELPLTEESTHP
ncbi:MAG: HAMP domain-containing sensor histidine kinase [Chlamydiota bacterium]